MTTGEASAGQWVSMSEAASALGVSTRTLRRKIASGELRRQEVDGRVHVWVPAVATPGGQTDTPPGQVDTAPDTAVQALATLERLLSAERDRASQAEQAAAMWQERARGLEAQLALPAPASRPWWQRWWRG